MSSYRSDYDCLKREEWCNKVFEDMVVTDSENTDTPSL